MDANHQEMLKETEEAIEWMQTIQPANNLSSHRAAQINRLVAAFQRITPQILEGLPLEDLDELRKTAQEARTHIMTRGGLIEKQACNSMHAVVQKCVERGTGMGRAIGEADGILAEMRAHQTKAESVLDVISKSATDAGVSKRANFFGKEADKCEAAASRWGKWVLAAVVAFVACAFWFISDSEGIDDGLALTLALANRALLFIALGYGVFFCAKNYTANLHNAVVNRHRQNALETYLAVVSAVKDEKHRDTVLAYAAQCIYVPQDSGFARRNSGSEISADTIIRLARGKMGE